MGIPHRQEALPLPRRVLLPEQILSAVHDGRHSDRARHYERNQLPGAVHFQPDYGPSSLRAREHQPVDPHDGALVAQQVHRHPDHRDHPRALVAHPPGRDREGVVGRRHGLPRDGLEQHRARGDVHLLDVLRPHHPAPQHVQARHRRQGRPLAAHDPPLQGRPRILHHRLPVEPARDGVHHAEPQRDHERHLQRPRGHLLHHRGVPRRAPPDQLLDQGPRGLLERHRPQLPRRAPRSDRRVHRDQPARARHGPAAQVRAQQRRARPDADVHGCGRGPHVGLQLGGRHDEDEDRGSRDGRRRDQRGVQASAVLSSSMRPRAPRRRARRAESRSCGRCAPAP